MGVDIETYRGRIGTFRLIFGLDVITVECCINFSRGLKTIGSVAFIGILLLIAGIESNPGPATSAKCTCSSNQTKIKVSAIESSVEEEDLEDLFGNKKKQGGGCVKKVTIFPDKACAIVEFEESEAVEKVLNKRPIKIKKKDVDVELYHTQHTIQLNGYLQDCTLDQIRTCLENHYGETVCITLSSRESDTMFVTFKDEKVARDVVIQGHLEIENERFSVVFHDPKMEMHGDFKVDTSKLDNDGILFCLCQRPVSIANLCADNRYCDNVILS